MALTSLTLVATVTVTVVMATMPDVGVVVSDSS